MKRSRWLWLCLTCMCIVGTILFILLNAATDSRQDIPAGAGPGASLWNRTYSNASTDAAYDVAADTSGRIFVVGHESGVEGGYGNLRSDWRIRALNATDGALIWNVSYSNVSRESPTGIAPDGLGRVFVSGFEVGVEGGHGHAKDWRIRALNASDGSLLWNVTYSNVLDDVATGVAADTSGRVFVVGYETRPWRGNVDTRDWRIVVRNAADGDAAVDEVGDTPDWQLVALNATDGTLIWNITYDDTAGDTTYILIADRYGLTHDWRIMALNATDGTSLWNVTYSNASDDVAEGVAVDTSGRVFVVGHETGIEGGYGGTADWRIMALNATDGTSLWNVTYSNALEDVAYGVAADNTGRIFVVGQEAGGEGGYDNSTDWRIMALDATDGTSLWNVTYSNALDDVAHGVTVDTSGRLFVVGYERGAEGGYGGTKDWRIMALNAADGMSLWNRTYSNASDDEARGVAADTLGRLFVVGYETGAEGGYGETRDWRIMALSTD